MAKVRVSIADHHEIVRIGLRSVIEREADLVLVAESRRTAEAIEAIERERPDVAVLALNMPDRVALDLLPSLSASAPDTHILVLTMFTDQMTMRRALAGGAHGFLSKEASHREIVSAIRALAAGRVVISVPSLNEGGARLRPLAPSRALSAREQQVLELFARGRSHREIADELCLHIKTIETYRSRLGDKFGASTRAELIANARALGMVAAAPQ